MRNYVITFHKVYKLMKIYLFMKKEKRKVNLVGQNTLTVSLPSKFISENNIEKGDELYSSFEKNEITFSLEERKSVDKEITINIDDFSYATLTKSLITLYITNYNKITLLHSGDEIVYFKNNKKLNLHSTIKKLVSRFIGAEIILQTPKKTEIECFLNNDNEDLEKIEKRIYFLLKDTFNELINSIGDNFSEFNDLAYDYHDNIDKFINYFLRKLDSSDKSEEEKKVAYSFYSFISTLVDNIRHISEKINKYGCSEKMKNYLEEIFEVFIELFVFLHKGHITKEITKKRYDLIEKINNEDLTANELWVFSEASIFLDTLNAFNEYSIVKALNEGLIKYK